MQRAAAQSHSLKSVREHYRRLAPEYDQKANATCKAAYRELVARVFAGAQSVIELGAGSSPLVTAVDAARRVACDLSLDMVGASVTPSAAICVVADAQQLPFADGTFDGAFCINLLEHAPEPSRVVLEAARVLRPGGRFLAVTPNGDLEWLLDALERLHLKLPEGPHRFLSFRDLAALTGDSFRLLEHRRFLTLPIGPWPIARRLDRIRPAREATGLFQFVVLEKPAPKA
jgi:ubiquinone/menaquinone biosynthesis C-methylase UbiE